MVDVERDLGTRLDWVATDHWNTDNPHVHVLIRGKAEDGQDLVISRAYISHGFRDRAAERATLELGPRSELEIRTALEKEVDAERWTGLDRALRSLADENGGVVDLRRGVANEDPERRRLMLGRAKKLERLGLAEQVGPASWTLKPGLEASLRDLSIRGDIIKTMHRALAGAGREPDVTGFALHGDGSADQVLGRLVARGLHDELKGSAYAIVEGVDGRTHHLQFTAETGLAHRPTADGEHVAGIYRQRVTLSSGRFAMIEDGLGFQLVPWRPALERHLGKQVTGIMSPASTVDWTFGPKRGLSR